MNAKQFLQLLFALLCTLISCTAVAGPLIIEPEDGRAPILSAITHAKHSIYLAMYGFTDKILFNALLWQKQQGREVKILLEDQPYRFSNENDKIITSLNANHINWKSKAPHFYLIHQKTLIIDHTLAIVMSFNFTQSTFQRTRNFGLIIEDPILVRDIEAVFLADWEHTTTPHHASSLIYSPEDSRAKLLAAIHQAKHTIEIYAQSISDYEMIRALTEAAHQGVAITLLTSSHIPAKKARPLKKAGIKIVYQRRLYIHAKAWIVDNETAIIGSTNLTRSSLDANRELSVMTQDPAVIAALRGAFEDDSRSE